MGDFFGGLRTGIQFPQVVMNQGPLPGAGGLPQPLHETPDARINYSSTLLGNLTPYAYGEPGYLSSQTSYLNIPHKIQKIVPVVFVPEARSPAKELIDVSHPIDDGDLAFVLRLDRNSMFCTGLKNAAMRRAGLGTAIDPFINLCTLNYLLSGMQLGVTNDSSNLWVEFLSNLDKHRFKNNRDYEGRDKITLDDVVHVVRHCVRPFGITRGSEKQGGQDEATLGAATWPVSFVVSLTIDGKESNVLNIWHNHELHAGNDLVLRLKPMPVMPYTLNHYYKSVKRQTWEDTVAQSKVRGFVWQLVPDLFDLEDTNSAEVVSRRNANRGWQDARTQLHHWQGNPRDEFPPWQELGYWYIGRSQIQTGKYGAGEYWHNDLANTLRTNHLDITLQPVWHCLPGRLQERRPDMGRIAARAKTKLQSSAPRWQPSLRLERLESKVEEVSSEPVPVEPAPQVVEVEPEPDWLGRLEFSDEVIAAPEPAAKSRKQAKRGSRPVGGSLLRPDGTSEPSQVGML